MTAQVRKPYKGMAMEGLIAKWYTGITRNDVEDRRKVLRTINENAPKGCSILEVAPGPGYLSIELAKSGNYRVSGLDISQTFVEIAQAKAREAGVTVEFRQGNASAMPFADDTFDFIVCRAAFKNFTDPVGAMSEMHRVLRPGGKALILDLRPDVPDETVDEYTRSLHMNPINAIMTKWTFKHMLSKSAHPKAELREFASQSSFGTCDVQEDGMGYAVWLHK